MTEDYFLISNLLSYLCKYIKEDYAERNRSYKTGIAGDGGW